MRGVTILFFLLTTISKIFAQESISIVEEDPIRRMMDSRKELNFQKNRYVKAWSIQLLVTRDKYLATKKKNDFSRQFENLTADWQYQQPYYKLSVGAYYTKLEAAMVLQQVIKLYPDAYIFKNSQAKTTDF